MYCNHCDGSGFLNIHQFPDELTDKGVNEHLNWMNTHANHDVKVCDCCGDGENWYGDPGQHYDGGDPKGMCGSYAYNGGLAGCH